MVLRSVYLRILSWLNVLFTRQVLRWVRRATLCVYIARSPGPLIVPYVLDVCVSVCQCLCVLVVRPLVCPSSFDWFSRKEGILPRRVGRVVVGSQRDSSCFLRF